MAKMIEVKDWADKHNTFIYTAAMQALGYIHQEAPMVWRAYDAAGNYIDCFDSKKEAKAALQ